MSEQTPGSAPTPLSLPDAPNLDWLRKEARRRLRALRGGNPAARLADAQFQLAREYGFSSWRALKAHVDSLTVDGRLFTAARDGDVRTLAELLDRHPEKLRVRDRPYEWSLLHHAAHGGHLAAVDLLLRRGLNVDTRERGDHTYSMHWAAAAGHLEVIRRLADAGGDVAGHGDDHELEVIGWATCWEACHHDVAELLVHRGARHHIFSAIAMNDADEVRRVVAADPTALERRMSRHEDRQRPLHFAVRKNLPGMVALLLELGADPLATDATGYTAAAYATTPEGDRAVMEVLRARGAMDLLAAVALGDWEAAERLMGEKAGTADGRGTRAGALHLMAKRRNAEAAEWLLNHGMDPNGRWWHWDAEVTPLHMAAWGGSEPVVRLLLAAGADPGVRDSEHHADAIEWASFFQHPQIVHLLAGRGAEEGS